MDLDILILMQGASDYGERDNFSGDADTKRSLLLDTVMQGRRRQSYCRFLQMPAEILADIVDFLADDKPALASLALVNSDCRYLSRSRQFAEIHFDYSHQAYQLFRHLKREAVRETDVTTLSFPIGVCVRRFTFAPRSEFLAAFYQDLHISTRTTAASSYSQEQRDMLLRQAGANHIEMRDMLTFVISLALPNLKVLSWDDPVSLGADFFANLSRCSAQHIKMARVKIDKPWLIRPPLTPALWPLRSLDVDMQLYQDLNDDQAEPSAIQDGALTEERHHPISDFFGTLLQRCAPTLESLSWTNLEYPKRCSDIISLRSYPLSFPHLRYLRLVRCTLHPLAFSSLLSSPLKHLELSRLDSEGLVKYFATCEPLRDLQSLIISSLPLSSETCMHVTRFIKQHQHVHKLLVHEQLTAPYGSDSQLDSLIIPILAKGQFNNLRCLSLAWGGGDVSDKVGRHPVHITETALMTLGMIVSLEKLSLSAGRLYGWRNKWLIDHDMLRFYLKPLSRLKLLALVCDTYPLDPSIGNIGAHRYYDLRLVRDSECDDAKARAHLDIDDISADVSTPMMENEWEFGEEMSDVQIWERAHRNRMLTQAEAYAAIFPALEWIYCGQRPMGFRSRPESHVASREAIPLTQHRARCLPFLNDTFGIYKQ